MKVKLPRKRKKRFLKDHGKENYLAMQIFGEILRETPEYKAKCRLKGYKADFVQHDPVTLSPVKFY